MSTPLVSIKDMTLRFTGARTVSAVNQISLELARAKAPHCGHCCACIRSAVRRRMGRFILTGKTYSD
jgi:hypothetical protein